MPDSSIDADLYRIEREKALRHPHNRFAKPQDILDLARRHHLVASVIAEWRMGAFSWEEAMMFLALRLADQNAKLMDSALMRIERDPSLIIVEKSPGASRSAIESECDTLRIENARLAKIVAERDAQLLGD